MTDLTNIRQLLALRGYTLAAVGATTESAYIEASPGPGAPNIVIHAVGDNLASAAAAIVARADEVTGRRP